MYIWWGGKGKIRWTSYKKYILLLKKEAYEDDAYKEEASEYDAIIEEEDGSRGSSSGVSGVSCNNKTEDVDGDNDEDEDAN